MPSPPHAKASSEPARRFAAAVNQISAALFEPIHGKGWAGAVTQQALQPSAVGGFDKHPGIDREAAAVGVSGRVFSVTCLNMAACHKGPQDAFAHEGPHGSDGALIESSGRMKSKVSLFSGLNNLKDITIDARYSALCGYTDADVDTVFAPELPGLDRQMIRDWYNGYNWLGTSVYNPFGLLLLFDSRQFKAHWFETGTPTFLIKLLQQRHVFTPDLSRIVASEELLSTFDVDNIPVEALMFQAGYLTIDSVRELPGRMQLTLKYPNLEVQSALNTSLLQSLTGSLSLPGPQITRLYDLLQAQDFAGLKTLFHAFYASIANDWYRKNELSSFEGYYASIFYSYFAALGVDIRLEDPTNVGRIDMTVLFAGQVFLFEFKVVEMNPAGAALQQLKDMGYADKYRALGQPIHLIGVEFSKASRNIVGFEVETLSIA